jgi:hypothetical protein
MRTFIAIAVGVAFACWALSGPAAAHARHSKHSHVRTVIVPYHRPYLEWPPGYSHGGPAYTTCDRINRDRMLVGTCR